MEQEQQQVSIRIPLDCAVRRKAGILSLVKGLREHSLEPRGDNTEVRIDRGMGQELGDLIVMVDLPEGR